MQRDKNKHNAEYWEATAGGFCTASAISDLLCDERIVRRNRNK